MTTTAPAQRPSTSAAEPTYGVGDTATLRVALAEIEHLGWDSPPGDAVLSYARTHVVGVAVRKARLTGAAADDATSTGWAAAWRMLGKQGLAEEPSPWGLVTAAVRREIARDQLGAAYRTNTHAACRLARLRRATTEHLVLDMSAPEPSDPGACNTTVRGPAGTPVDRAAGGSMDVDHRNVTEPHARGSAAGASVTADLGADANWLRGLTPDQAAFPLSLDRWARNPQALPEPTAVATGQSAGLGPRLDLIVDALAQAGWPADLAASCVAWTVGAAANAAQTQVRRTAELPGWRELARQAGLPTWRTRRLASLLLGYRDTAGLLARMVADGDHVLQEPDVQRAVRSTLHRWVPTPTAESSSIGTTNGGRRWSAPAAA